jgi:geranylgeranyl diphosphate synthase type I
MTDSSKIKQPVEKQPSIKELLAESKTQISQQLRMHILDTVRDMQNVSKLTQDLKEILLPLALSGKMIRGSLVWYMYQFSLCEHNFVDASSNASSSKNLSIDSMQITPLSKNHVLTVSAAFELIQAGLLIHDDIMDNDDLRRGVPTVHVQYQERHGKNANANPRIGEHMAICLGDESLFLAMGLLSQIPDPYAARIMRFIVPQLIKTGIGQSQDVLGASVATISTTEIETIYLHKTAAYTFTIPLTTGLILANRSEDISFSQIASLGESLGLLFQLRDDYLGILGDEKETGKNVFSDISENKKTLIRQAILAQAKLDNKEDWFFSIFGNQDVTIKEVLSVREYMEETGILSKIESDMDRYKSQALKKIEELAISAEGRKFFEELVTYLRYRNT